MTKQLNKKGTSLVELIAVIVIMGIIAGIAIPTTIAVINRQKKNAALKSADNVLAAAKNVLLEASSQGTSGSLIGNANEKVHRESDGSYTVTELALVALGELEKRVSEEGTVTITLTTVSETQETGTTSFSVATEGWKINGYTIAPNACCDGFQIASNS